MVCIKDGNGPNHLCRLILWPQTYTVLLLLLIHVQGFKHTRIVHLHLQLGWALFCMPSEHTRSVAGPVAIRMHRRCFTPHEDRTATSVCFHINIYHIYIYIYKNYYKIYINVYYAIIN